MHPFSTPRCFQKVEKGGIGNEWVIGLKSSRSSYLESVTWNSESQMVFSTIQRDANWPKCKRKVSSYLGN